MNTKLLIVEKIHSMTIFLVVVCCLSLTAVLGQRLEDRRVTVIQDEAAFGEIIETLIEEYDVPFGLEEAAGSRTIDYAFETNVHYDLKRAPRMLYTQGQKRFSLNFRNIPLHTVLDSLVAQMPNYRWRVDNGIVVFFPARDRDQVLERLLKLKIKSFSLNEPPIFAVQDALLALPEVTQFFETEGVCVSSLPGLNIISPRRKLTHSFEFSDIEFGDLLNEITSIKRGGWFLRRSRFSNGNECIVIRI